MFTDYLIHKTKLSLHLGDITRVDADALVSSDDNYVTMSDGVARAILQATGEQIRQDVQKHQPIRMGDVVVTSAGQLKARYIFHVITIDFDRMILMSDGNLREATQRCLALADALNVRSIAFPLLGSGARGFPKDQVAQHMLRAIADYISANTGLTQVLLVFYSRPGRNDESYTQQLLHQAQRLAAELSQRRRVSSLLGELHAALLASPLEQELTALRQDLDALELSLGNIRHRAAALALTQAEATSPTASPSDIVPKSLSTATGVRFDALRQTCEDRLSVDEVQAIAFDILGPNHTISHSDTKKKQVIALITTLYYRQSLGALMTWLTQNRPDLQINHRT